MMSPFLALTQARKLMPYDLANDTVAHMLLTLAFLKILSDDWCIERVLGQAASSNEADLITSMAARGRVVMHERSLFDNLRRAEQPGLAIKQAMIALAQAQPNGILDEVLLPERFGLLQGYFNNLNNPGNLVAILNLVGEMAIEDATPSIAAAAAFALLTGTLCPASHRAELLTAQLMAQLVQPQAHERILDPACGIGITLLACAEVLGEGMAATLHLQGTESDVLQSSLAKMLMILSGLPQTHIAMPENASVHPGEQAEVVITMLPDAGSGWPGSRTGKCRPRRLPPVLADDPDTLAWQAIKRMQPGAGRMALLLPPGVLNEAQRYLLGQHLVTHQWLDAVVTLPPVGLVDQASGALLLLVRQQKRQSGVAFIAPHRNQSGGYEACTRQDVVAAHDAYQHGQPHPALRIVEAATLAENLYHFDVREYPLPAQQNHAAC